jgi:hypothetical protein
MFEYINGWEWLLIGVLLFASIIMIALMEDDEMMVAGLIVMVMIFVLAYETHSGNLDKAFVLQQFQEGQALKCGGFGGESTLVDPHNGWKYINTIGFIKGDQIRNDPGMCCVIDRVAPEPSIVPYTFAFVTLIFLSFLLRHAVKSQEEKEEVKENEKIMEEPNE